MTTDEREQMWRAIAKEYPQPYPKNYVTMSDSYGSHMFQFSTTRNKVKPPVHYEWLLLDNDNTLEVAVHFEMPKTEANEKAMKKMLVDHPELEGGLEHDFFSGPRKPSNTWYHLGYRVDCAGLSPAEIKNEAIRTMRYLMKVTKPSVDG